MCRWVAYAGPAIFLEDLLFNQEHSLVQQSFAAREARWTTNADGFGVAWYGRRDAPGVFKDILPAWNDANLRAIASHIESDLFFAHVRSSTGTSVARSNCHPFSYRNWTFMHNGQIGGWTICRKDVETLISREHYVHRIGSTDSEALFLAALSNGLTDEPIAAMTRTIAQVIEIMQAHAIDEPLRLSAACTDGTSIWAFRYSSDDQSPSLYYGTPQLHAERLPGGAVSTIASEPSDSDSGRWHRIGERTGLKWSRGSVTHFDIEVPVTRALSPLQA